MEQGNVIRLYDEEGNELVHTPMSVGVMVRKIAQLEVRLSNEIESRDGWKEAWKKSEARLSKMEEALRTLADPMSYEHIGKFHGRKLPWSIAKEALGGNDE